MAPASGPAAFIGHGYSGAVKHRENFGEAIISRGFIDLDALSDLDTTIPELDNRQCGKRGAFGPKAICGPIRAR